MTRNTVGLLGKGWGSSRKIKLVPSAENGGADVQRSATTQYSANNNIRISTSLVIIIVKNGFDWATLVFSVKRSRKR